MADPTASQVALTPKELHILKHALGVPDAKRAPKEFYRSHFVTGVGSVDHPGCMRLAELGLMSRRPGSALSGGDDIFLVTKAGEQFVRAHLNESPSL
jgi:hypothetical protein